ncbi:MAG: putative sulfate exporter family transporter [Phycisphaerales bacterium]|nr:putative sulfate exporter family transporter [Phycisphaerales bacterium]
MPPPSPAPSPSPSTAHPAASRTHIAILLTFSLLALFAPFITPAIALALGIILGLLGISPLPTLQKNASKLLIQISIVLLGFTLSLSQVALAGRAGLAFSTGAIILVLIISELLARVLKTDRPVATLLSAGTAICGGSAIATTGQVIHAPAAAIALSTAIVFILNAVGVFAYPFIGRVLGLTDHQFGAWCAVGVHDVAGVVAASADYMGTKVAQQDATVIKLIRVLWIVPVAFVLGHIHRKALSASRDQSPSAAKAPFPWFTVYFVFACLLRAGLDGLFSADTQTIASIASYVKLVASHLLSLALLLIGTGLTRNAIAAVGWKPALHGLVLWLIISAASLFAAMHLL